MDGNADGRFEINRTAGKIRNKLILDREQQDLYTLTVQAEDCGTHSRSALLLFTLERKGMTSTNAEDISDML